MRHALIALALALTACDGSGITLVVLLRSDLTPGVEVTEAQVRVGETVRRVPLSARDDLLRGFRLAEFTGLSPDPNRWVEVRLLQPSGALVMTRTVVIDHQRDQGVVVPMSRSCRDITCPGQQTCHAGRCVDPRCQPDDPTCGADECTADVDCPAPSECASATCVDGACYLQAFSDRCGAGQYCDPDDGCHDQVDAGVLPADAGTGAGTDAGFDAGLDAGFDAGFDAGPPPLSRVISREGSTWTEQTLTGEGPIDRVLGAFTAPSEVVVLTSTEVFFLDWPARRWVGRTTLAAAFPGLSSGMNATMWPSASGDRVRMFNVGAGWHEYRWSGRSGTLIETTSVNTPSSVWGSTDAPQVFRRLAVTNPGNAEGWIDPSGCSATIGEHVFFLSNDGFGPILWHYNAYVAACNAFVPESSVHYPVVAPDAAPGTVHAGTIAGGALILFVEADPDR